MKFEAAFRNRLTKVVYATGYRHDPGLLPEPTGTQYEMSPELFQEGFVDQSFKFYSRFGATRALNLKNKAGRYFAGHAPDVIWSAGD